MFVQSELGVIMAALKFDASGLIPAVIQDMNTLQVLMVGWMNAEAFQKTCETGQVTFWSRSRKRLWQKGETSGNVLLVRKVRLDCDGDTLLVQVFPTGPTCHTGETSCFFRELGEGDVFRTI